MCLRCYFPSVAIKRLTVNSRTPGHIGIRIIQQAGNITKRCTIKLLTATEPFRGMRKERIYSTKSRKERASTFPCDESTESKIYFLPKLFFEKSKNTFIL